MLYEDFTFTDWFDNEEFEKFYSQTKDVFNHDRCTHCGVWVQTIAKDVPENYKALLVICPNCGAEEYFL